MDRYDLSTRACTKLADLKIAKIAILVSVAAGIMSGFPVARKALKGAGSDDTSGKPNHDDGNATGGMPSPLAAPKTPDQLAEMEHEDQDLFPKPLKLRNSNSPDDKDGKMSFSDMLKTDPREESGPQKVKLATSLTSPSKENEKYLGGHEGYMCPSTRTKAPTMGSKTLGLRQSNATNPTDHGNNEMSRIHRAMTDPFQELNSPRGPAMTTTTPPTPENWQHSNSWRGHHNRFNFTKDNKLQFTLEGGSRSDSVIVEHSFPSTSKAKATLTRKSSSPDLDGMSTHYARNSNEKGNEFSLQDMDRTDLACETETSLRDILMSGPDDDSNIDSPTRKDKKPSPFASLRRKVSSVFTSDSSDHIKTRNELTGAMFSPAKSGGRKISLASVGEGSSTKPSITPRGSTINLNGASSSLGECSAYSGPEENMNPWSTPSAKRTAKKNVLTVDTTKASNETGALSHESPLVEEGPSSDIAIAGGSSSSVYTDTHPDVKRVEEAYLQDVFGVQSTNDLYDAPPTRTPMAGHPLYSKDRSRIDSPSPIVISNRPNPLIPLPLRITPPKSGKVESTSSITKMTDSPTKQRKPSQASTVAPANDLEFNNDVTPGAGCVGRQSLSGELESRQLSQATKVAHAAQSTSGVASTPNGESAISEAPWKITQKSASSSSYKTASLDENPPEEVGQVFFFEEFHNTHIQGDADEDNDCEGKGKSKAILDTDSEDSSDGSTIKGVQAISQDMSKAVPEGRKMNEATRQDQIAHEKETAHKKADAPHDKKHEDYKAFKVDELRKKTGTEIVLYSQTDLRPKHPNHQRKWNAKNLYCTTCQGHCAVCSEPCCAMMKCLDVVTNDQDPANLTPEANTAGWQARDIDYWVGAFGVDQPTFMRCTQCFKAVCPDCCSICPVLPCHDRLCRKCNRKGQWKCCKYHDKADIPDSVPEYQRFQHQR